MLRSFLALSLALLLVPFAGAQDFFAFGAPLSGANEVPPNNSTGQGFVSVVYVDNPGITPDVFTVRGAFGGLTDDYLFSHLHEAPAGSNGPIIQTLDATVGLDNRSGEWELANNTYPAPAGFLADLQAGLIYTNVHSDAFPGGELRGQLVAVPFVDGDLSDAQYQTLATKQNANAGFGPDIDATEIVYYPDFENGALFIGIKGKLNTLSSDGIGLWLDFSELSGVPAGDSLGGVPNGGHFIGSAGRGDYAADFEVDYAFALNPGSTNTTVFFDAAKYVGTPDADYLGSAGQDGVAAFGPADSLTNNGNAPFFTNVAFAFDNSGTADTGLEFVLSFADLGIDGTENFSSLSASAFVVSSTAYFSDVTVPGNVTAGNLGFGPDFNANLTDADCACTNPSSTIGTGPYNATAAFGANPNFDLKATALTSLSVPAGGSIQFSYAVTNNTGNSASGQLFFTATGGRQGVIRSGSIGPNQSIGPLTFTQLIPASTPPGTYTYTLNIGNFPGTSVDSESFTITVTAAPRQASSGATEWTVVDAQPWTAAATASASADGAISVAPNPLSSSAQLTFALDARTDVTLSVFDVRGREVARLVDGALDAGTHTATFDATAFPSGVYVYRLSTGTSLETGRLTVLR